MLKKLKQMLGLLEEDESMDDKRAYKEAHNQDEEKGGILWI